MRIDPSCGVALRLARSVGGAGQVSAEAGGFQAGEAGEQDGIEALDHSLTI